MNQQCYIVGIDGRPCNEPVTHERKTLATTVHLCEKHARLWNESRVGKRVGKGLPANRAVLVEGAS